MRLGVSPTHHGDRHFDIGRRIASIRKGHALRHLLQLRLAVGAAARVPLARQRGKQPHRAQHPLARDQPQAVTKAEAVQQRDIKVGVPAHQFFPCIISHSVP